MKIEEYIKIKSGNLGYRVFIAPDIPMKKLNNCVNYIANSSVTDYIICVGDATVFGKTRIGFALTGKSLFFANNSGDATELFWEEIYSAKYYKKSSRRENVFAVGDKVEIIMRNNRTYYMDACLIGFDCLVMEKLINGIVELVNNGEIPIATKQNVTLEEIEDKYKLLYLKILSNYAYVNDSYIDSQEYAAIQNIIVRIGLSPSARDELRTYMTEIDLKEKTGDLLYKLKVGLEYGSYDISRYSLMQDVLYLHNIAKRGISWIEDGFIGSLMAFLYLQPEQLELMIYAIDLNRQMVTEDSNIIDLQSKYQELIKGALSLRVPVMTLYCSGSVYSVDTYRKFFNGNEQAQLAINKQRELMLQTIIKNTQETVNHLVIDMNHISEQLVTEIQRGMQSSVKIERLSALLARLSKGAEESIAKTENVEQYALYSKLPNSLDMKKLENIRKDKKCEVEYYNIVKCYEYEEATNQVKIKQNLETRELTKLIGLFQGINY